MLRDVSHVFVVSSVRGVLKPSPIVGGLACSLKLCIVMSFQVGVDADGNA